MNNSSNAFSNQINHKVLLQNNDEVVDIEASQEFYEEAPKNKNKKRASPTQEILLH